ncbi:tRNA (cytidine(34)-2'-O)-methyltransferase [Spirochaetia bacterium 38H-sp]|uniref:Putative tRNA (cytidine(34)-2'-O)-methyltransferase n=1 Tax=Rarispira pelagica TaxID=3141764 RepID=A0ABU9UC99_9SPIR
MSLSIVLFEPEIPQNTGNIARTCAATGVKLYLVEPLGFSLEDKYLKRAGLDYWPMVDLDVLKSWDEVESLLDKENFFLVSKFAERTYTEIAYPDDSILVFGSESRGLPDYIKEKYKERLIRIPMRSSARSLNLSNAVAIMAYEVLRQHGFPGLARAFQEDV